MVTGIVGTDYETRFQVGRFEINHIDDIINKTGIPYIKGQFLSPTPELETKQKEIAVTTLKTLVEEEVNLSGTNLLGVSVISPISQYWLLTMWSSGYEIEPAETYHWHRSDAAGLKRLEQAKPCTRELEILAGLTKPYSHLLRSPCTKQDLRNYSKAWPPEGPLI